MIFSGKSNEVFCDALSVTYSPADSPILDIQKFILDVGGWPQNPFKCSYQYGAPSTSKTQGDMWFRMLERAKFTKIEIKAKGISFLRAHGYWEEYLSLLGSSPHTVTRLDAAHDFPLDYSDVSEVFLSHFPSWRVPLSRKGYAMEKRYETMRPDNKLTSTIYVGDRGRTKYYLRLYDKMFEMWSRDKDKSKELGAPLTRLELECAKEVNCSLKDAYDPAPLFYHVLKELLFKDVQGSVREWIPGGEFTWKMPAIEKLHPAVRLKSLVDGSQDVKNILHLSSQVSKEGFRKVLANKEVNNVSSNRWPSGN